MFPRGYARLSPDSISETIKMEMGCRGAWRQSARACNPIAALPSSEVQQRVAELLQRRRAAETAKKPPASTKPRKLKRTRPV
jgi:hypothetical protein